MRQVTVLFVHHESDLAPTQATVEALKSAARAYRRQPEKPQFLLLNSVVLAELAWDDGSCLGTWFPGLLENELKGFAVEGVELVGGSEDALRDCLERIKVREGAERVTLLNKDEVPTDTLTMILFRISRRRG